MKISYSIKSDLLINKLINCFENKLAIKTKNSARKNIEIK
jgi:hypothetical protein